jgi:anti-sigma factor RsiW
MINLFARPYRCAEIVELVSDYLEGSLSKRQRARFEAHIAGCEHCHAYLDQMRLTIELSGRLDEDDLSDAMRSEFGEVFRRMREEGEI